MPTIIKNFLILFIASATLGGCASSVMKARKEQREKAAQTSKLYCDFVNGEIYPDVEVMLNLEMAKRCDSQKSYSISNYKTSNENMGVLYCCTLTEKDKPEVKSASIPTPMTESKAESKIEAKAEAKAEVKTDAKPEPKPPVKKATVDDDGLGD